ncbi:hypothetical protein [Pararobbsia alpina]|uniref:Uncharacterized protein n=1 Tax=Pararobbsia alpina TaxID=621374 RepID=A0A6S7B101_9BURK|nr:hypothetical protein [Pararobbsia alpina]CAB3784402.1 hypothetical protein LMG28138_01802 [Pararobbsia alpina]
MKPAKPTHGGAREGAGRKTSDGAKGVVPVNITLTPEEREKLKALGGSAWVRAQLRGA